MTNEYPFQAFFDKEDAPVVGVDATPVEIRAGQNSQESNSEIPDEDTVLGAEEINAPLPVSTKKRLGIHYFADEDHYHSADLELWMPVLEVLGVNWITLYAPADRAIPYEFITALIERDIQPILQFHLPLTETPPVEEFAPLLRAYSNWGVRYIVLYDRPNLRDQWPGVAWTQRGLVERFLDLYVPMAKTVIEAGMTPVFPALEPGGDYWDTAFLRGALQALQDRGEGDLLQAMALGAYAWTEDKSMTWGAGGPEAWPATMPYHTPKESEDQRGFRIFDWYNAISGAVTGKELPIIIVAAGVERTDDKRRDAMMGKRAINIATTLARDADPDKNNAVPANVLACNLWLLAAGPESGYEHSAWFKLNGKPTKVGEEWLAWKYPDLAKTVPPAREPMAELAASAPKEAVETSKARGSKGNAISHYLLLPRTGEWPMEAIRIFIQHHGATVGTSEQEATNSNRVTLAGGLDAFSDDAIRSLIAAGCTIDHLPIETA